jgi:hypothetical protein
MKELTQPSFCFLTVNIGKTSKKTAYVSIICLTCSAPKCSIRLPDHSDALPARFPIFKSAQTVFYELSKELINLKIYIDFF